MQTMAVTLTEGEQNAAVAGGIAGAMISSMFIFAIIFYIITLIATWKIFKKAGEPGWKCLIPIYNIYVMYKIVGMSGWFWGILLINIATYIVMSIDNTTYLLTSESQVVFDASVHIPTVIALVVDCIVTLVGEIIYAWRTSKAFGHGVGYFLGLLFLQPIFWLIIGFGSSKYHKKAVR